MKYCVVKGTTKIIDGSGNPVEIMARNAQNAGFAESEFEILTEEEYLARKELEPKPIELPSVEERLKAAEDTIIYLLMNGGV